MLKNIIVSGTKLKNKTVVFVNLATVLLVVTPLYARAPVCSTPKKMKDNTYRVDYEGCKDVDAENVLRSQYGEQQYQKCVFNKVFVSYSSSDVKLPITEDYSLQIEKKFPFCTTVFYYTSDDVADKDRTLIRFQCMDARMYNAEMSVKKDVLAKGDLCAIIARTLQSIQY